MSTLPTGNLQETPLSDILETLRQRKATGTLTLNRGAVSKAIYIRDGQIVFATSTDTRDRLGEILVKTGKLSRENLERALQLASRSAVYKKLGAVLVENGLIPPKELFSGLKVQVNEIIYSVVLWREGTYQFTNQLPADIIQLQIDFQELIAEIIARIKRES